MNKGAIESLDSKQTALFKSLYKKFFETKQYKKGLKHSKKLLEQNPNVAESMAMHAIFLYYNGSKAEGIDLSKKALMKNLKSELAWHMYGHINRSNKNFQEAINCYKKALDITPKNIEILRDLAQLQVQIRDVDGLCDTRRKILMNQDSVIVNWVGYAFSLHLKGECEEALKVIDSINNITKNNPLTGIEKSEFTLYHAQVYADSGNYEMQLKLLDTNEETITDKASLYEMKAFALRKLGQTDAAIAQIEKLIEFNPYNKQSYNLLKEYKGIPAVPQNEEEREKIVAFFDEAAAKYKTSIVSYMGQEYSTGADFEKKLVAYILPYYRKGIPSLFSELKHLYNQADKVQIIEKVLLSNQITLENSSKFEGSETVESPCCLLWNLMLLAQHFDRTGQLNKALEYVNKAIEHTPTLIELYLVKAKILKHQFNHVLAFEQTEKARMMDLADRYLNNKAIKYAFRCGKIEQANELLRLFLKDPSEGNPYELQALWFETAQGEIFLQRGEYPKAMRMFKFVQKAFQEIYEDQFDFHTYCLRRYTLNTYTRLLNYENGVFNQKPFVKACTLLIRCLMEYTAVRQLEIKKKEAEDLRIKNLSQVEKKKWKKQQELEAAKILKDPFTEFRKKNDLDGEEFKSSQPLVEANSVAKQLVHTSIPNTLLSYKSAQVLVDFYIETNRPLLLIKSLNKVIKSNQCQNGIHQCKLKAALYLQKYLVGEKLNETIKQFCQEALKGILGDLSIAEFNSQFHAKNPQTGYRNPLHKIKSDITLGQSTNADLHAFYESQLSSPEKLSLKDAVRLYDDYIKINDFNENPAISAKLQDAFPDSKYYFSLKRFDEILV